MSAYPRIAIVGAGIVGASLAYHLARRGAVVTLVDRGRPAGGVTRSAFAWLNIAHGQPETYAQLRHLALEDYRRLERELGGALRVDWCGALTWHEDPAATERFQRAHAAWGYDLRLLGHAEIVAREPALTAPPSVAALAGGEGALDPVAAVESLVRAAAEAGATLRFEEEVRAIATRSGKATGLETARGKIEADLVLVAAGTQAPKLLAPLGLDLPVSPSPAILLRFSTPRPLVRGIVVGPAMEVRQAAPDLLLAAEDYIDDSPENGPQAVAARAQAAIRRNLNGGEEIKLESVEVGWRPMPADDLPIVGFADSIEGLYLASMHGAIILAPTIGRLATAEILDEIRAKPLEGCRLARFAAAAP